MLDLLESVQNLCRWQLFFILAFLDVNGGIFVERLVRNGAWRRSLTSQGPDYG